MNIRLEKIIAAKNQHRFYAMSVDLTLFGEWALVKEWGRIGSRGGRRQTEWHTCPESAEQAMGVLKRQKKGRGYVARPVQLRLSL